MSISSLSQEHSSCASLSSSLSSPTTKPSHFWTHDEETYTRDRTPSPRNSADKGVSLPEAGLAALPGANDVLEVTTKRSQLAPQAPSCSSSISSQRDDDDDYYSSPSQHDSSSEDDRPRLMEARRDALLRRPDVRAFLGGDTVSGTSPLTDGQRQATTTTRQSKSGCRFFLSSLSSSDRLHHSSSHTCKDDNKEEFRVGFGEDGDVSLPEVGWAALLGRSDVRAFLKGAAAPKRGAPPALQPPGATGIETPPKIQRKMIGVPWDSSRFSISSGETRWEIRKKRAIESAKTQASRSKKTRWRSSLMNKALALYESDRHGCGEVNNKSGEKSLESRWKHGRESTSCCKLDGSSNIPTMVKILQDWKSLTSRNLLSDNEPVPLVDMISNDSENSEKVEDGDNKSDTYRPPKNLASSRDQSIHSMDLAEIFATVNESSPDLTPLMSMKLLSECVASASSAMKYDADSPPRMNGEKTEMRAERLDDRPKIPGDSLDSESSRHIDNLDEVRKSQLVAIHLFTSRYPQIERTVCSEDSAVIAHLEKEEAQQVIELTPNLNESASRVASIPHTLAGCAEKEVSFAFSLSDSLDTGGDSRLEEVVIFASLGGGGGFWNCLSKAFLHWDNSKTSHHYSSCSCSPKILRCMIVFSATITILVSALAIAFAVGRLRNPHGCFLRMGHCGQEEGVVASSLEEDLKGRTWVTPAAQTTTLPPPPPPKNVGGENSESKAKTGEQQSANISMKGTSTLPAQTVPTSVPSTTTSGGTTRQSEQQLVHTVATSLTLNPLDEFIDEKSEGVEIGPNDSDDLNACSDGCAHGFSAEDGGDENGGDDESEYRDDEINSKSKNVDAEERHRKHRPEYDAGHLLV
uniref:Transmembrane protein n=1 Tax=Odontella aurita TaxID=265563 RepID=A0A7S4JEY4_9STRA|mmetsp:Transcript_45299/g.137985  ORF Transcript_45299/g.137985 Transcript_45299/m.137985 type:complete len:862 (+) Transcript_45299:359-2944(+)